MRRLRHILCGILAMLLLALPACSSAAAVSAQVTAVTPRPLPEPEGLRIAVASDLHLHETQRGDAPIQADYSMELVDALLWDAQRQGAAFLLLTGDIVNGGRAARHETLCAKLARAEAAGLDVYVLPGNHDLSPVTQTEFAALYDEFGFAEAYSRDESSLSYCIRRDGLLILMLDTGGYPGAACDLPGSEGTGSALVSPATLRWVEAMLREAQTQSLRVLCAGHYNLLSALASDPGYDGYYVQNGEALAALLREYGVLLYLSGHIHTRAFYRVGGLRELVTEYLLSYPTGYSVLDLSARQLRYTPRRVDVDAWAAESGQHDPRLLHYARWQQEDLYRGAASTVASMAARNPLSEAEEADAAEFFYGVLNAYWQGTLADRREALEAMPGRAAFFRCAEGFAYGWWLHTLLDSATPELAGFTVLLGG